MTNCPLKKEGELEKPPLQWLNCFYVVNETKFATYCLNLIASGRILTCNLLRTSLCLSLNWYLYNSWWRHMFLLLCGLWCMRLLINFQSNVSLLNCLQMPLIKIELHKQKKCMLKLFFPVYLGILSVYFNQYFLQ